MPADEPAPELLPATRPQPAILSMEFADGPQMTAEGAVFSIRARTRRSTVVHVAVSRPLEAGEDPVFAATVSGLTTREVTELAGTLSDEWHKQAPDDRVPWHGWLRERLVAEIGDRAPDLGGFRDV
jgi:hypothetical protein